MNRRQLLMAGAAVGLPGLGLPSPSFAQDPDRADASLAPAPVGTARIAQTSARTDRVYRIHPGIGIARVGNCQSTTEDGYFLGPEAPGHHVVPSGGYKLGGEIKRQGARFRIYEYARDPASGTLQPVREITSDHAEITWTVTLANRKAYAPLFPLQFDDQGRPRLRNATIADDAQRQQLLIISARDNIRESDPGPRPLDGYFMDPSHSREDHRVHLGDLLTDQKGHLIVLGGYGRAFSPTNTLLSTVFNNDGWCDETSDGTIRATIVLRATGDSVDTEDAARIIVAPPDFAPAIESIVSLYDIAEDRAAQLPNRALPDPRTVSFARDIFPILRRAVEMRWVTQSADAGHAPGRGGDFLDPELLPLLRDPDNTPGSAPLNQRQKVSSRLRKPPDFGPNETLQDMPLLNGDAQTDFVLTLTPRQYRLIQRWADGDFDPDLEVDLTAAAPSFGQITDIQQQTRALDQAGLDACAGGPFNPGIEVSQIMRDPSIYREPLRLRDDIPEGTLTAGMSLPWQKDFQECGQGWWPAQHPTEVLRRNPVTAAYERSSWADLGESLVTTWPRLGFVVPLGDLYVLE